MIFTANRITNYGTVSVSSQQTGTKRRIESAANTSAILEQAARELTKMQLCSILYAAFTCIASTKLLAR